MKYLVTGGSSGLGEAIVRQLCKDPDNTVYFTYRSSMEKAQEIETQLNNAKAIVCDFSSSESVQALGEFIGSNPLDVLINNAFAGEPLASYSYKNPVELYAKDFENNVLPTLQITKAALGVFKKQKNGKVITILTSFIHGTPPTGSSSYVATKSYLRSMAKSWASECIKFNVSSNTISPSFMQTQFTADVDSRIIESMEKEHPLKEILPVSEVVKAVEYLCASSNHVNGIDILINAGASLS